MKNLIIASVVFTSALSYGATKKESWKCSQYGMTVLKASFTDKSSVAKYSSPEVYIPDAELKLADKSQVTALNGSNKTILTGETIDHDSYYYTITLVRSENGGEAIIETTADLDCYGRTFNVESIACEVIVE